MNLPRLIRKQPRKAPVSRLTIRHADETYDVQLRRTAGAMRFTLRVRIASGDVVLTMPPRSAVADARAFAEQYGAWIGARLKRTPSPVPFACGSVIPLRGVDHVIDHRPNARGTVWVDVVDGAAEPFHRLCVAGDAPHVHRRISDFLKRCAKNDLELAVSRHCAKLNLPARSVTVRDTVSRWGSCSSNGALNFSWRLILAPAFVLDYLAAHEVAHLVHMNHSPSFWTVARRLSPDTDRAEAWLNAHGAKLHRYGKAERPDQPGAI